MGRPRDHEATALVLKTTFDLLDEDSFAHLTVQKIAESIGYKKQNIAYFLRIRGIKTINSANCKPDGSFTKVITRCIISKTELQNLYGNNLLTSSEIAKINGCNKSTIVQYLKKYEIPVRTQSESMKVRYAKGMMAGFRKKKHNRYERTEP